MSHGEKVKEFYSYDIVYKFNKHKKIIFGVVIDSYEASSDVDESHALQKGQIRVLWNNSSREQVYRQSKVRLMSRSVIPGDIVRRLENGKETQRGYCKESKKVAHVQIVGTDKVIENVSGGRLHNVRPFDIDDAVCIDTKFGRVESVDQEVTMLSKCGSVVKILTSINHDINDYWLMKRNRCLFEACYPGQELICTPSDFEQPEWIKKTKTMKRNMQNRQRFTVQNVEDCLIEVSWFSGADKENAIQELKTDEIKKLKVLDQSKINENYYELASRCLLKLNHFDILLKKKDWIHKLSVTHRGTESNKRKLNCDSKSSNKVPKLRSSFVYLSPVSQNTPSDGEWSTDEEDDDLTWDNLSTTSDSSSIPSKKCHFPPRTTELVPGNSLAVEILCVESKATIVWQDGSEEANIPTTELYYSTSLDDHEFFPGEWVVKNNDKEFTEYGVIQNVKYLERTACVKWFTFDAEKSTPTELRDNEMSVYDLKKHPKFVFRPNSIVKTIPAQDNVMGRVIDSCPQGFVIVKWLDGSQTQHYPQNIELIPETHDYDLSESEFDEDDEGQVSWETESIESYAGDLTDETTLQNMAARLDFIRNRVNYLKTVFKEHTCQENFNFLKDLLLVYDNFSYLDKLLGTSFFSLKSKHFLVLLTQVKEKAKVAGVELRGRLFTNDNPTPSFTKPKVAEKENINKVMKIENLINAQIENNKEDKILTPLSDLTPTEITDVTQVTQENLLIELLSMLKIRMDLAYAEIISKIGSPQALTIISQGNNEIPMPARSTPIPTSLPTTPDESFSSLSPPKLIQSVPSLESESYKTLEEAPENHHYFNQNKFEPSDLQRFLKAVQKEYQLLRESLPPGVWVRSYGNRLDLLSVAIVGPAKTPYEDGLFFFDIQLSPDYPRSPPLVHYISYSSERLNPNLYVSGKVCISLLGTWAGRGPTEVWGPNSTLLQLIVSIQGLILNSEPYFNEAGYDKQTDTQQGYENSRIYNELVILKLVQSMTELLLHPVEVFKQELLTHFALNGKKLCQRLQRFCSDTDPLKPDFALFPVSKGLKLSLSASLVNFQEVLKKVISNNEEKSNS